MTVDRFVADRADQWTELEGLVRAAGSRPERLGATRVRRLGELYRAAAADLAAARRRWPTEPAVARLDDLVGRARIAVYGRSTRRDSFVAFFSRRYWTRVRDARAALLISALLLFAPMAAATLWGHSDPQMATRIVPGALRGESDEVGIGSLEPGEKATFSAEIMTNNIRVTFLTLAGGVTGGVVTALTLVYNGLLIGALGGALLLVGSGPVFLELVAPHGVLELSCIVVSGAAGLGMGAALVAPGDRRRTAALADAARVATELALGTAPWLVVAGLVEGFVTPEQIGLWPALVVGIALGAVYWLLVVLRAERAPSA